MFCCVYATLCITYTFLHPCTLACSDLNTDTSTSGGLNVTVLVILLAALALAVTLSACFHKLDDANFPSKDVSAEREACFTETGTVGLPEDSGLPEPRYVLYRRWRKSHTSVVSPRLEDDPEVSEVSRNTGNFPGNGRNILGAPGTFPHLAETLLGAFDLLWRGFVSRFLRALVQRHTILSLRFSSLRAQVVHTRAERVLVSFSVFCVCALVSSIVLAWPCVSSVYLSLLSPLLASMGAAVCGFLLSRLFYT